MNSFGDNRSSKILFGKRKNWPLQFLCIRKPPLKLFERIFCWVKTKKKNTFQKTPSTIRRKFPILFGCFAKFFTPCLHLISPQQKKSPYIIQRKIQVLLMCFQKKFTNYFTQKEVCSICRANLFLYLQLIVI